MNCDTTSDDDGFVDCPICNGTGWLLTANDIAKLHQELDNLQKSLRSWIQIVTRLNTLLKNMHESSRNKY